MFELCGRLQALLLCLALGLCLPALAQRLPQPSTRPAADVAASTEIATTAWRRDQLDAWWAGLRRQALSADARLDLPAELLPPVDAEAWTP